MKTLLFDYYMQIDYAVEIFRCNFTIKCIPKDTARQKIRDLQIELQPPVAYQSGVDGLGNRQIYGLNEAPHKTFFFRITGTAEVGNADYETEAEEGLSMVFGHPFGRNRAGESIRAYHQRIRPDRNLSPLLRARYLMDCLHRDFSYQAGTTGMNTTAEEAFSQGCGVCQDYAHIFIALLHLEKIPARYVTGLLIGEGASHAWVEILDQGKWYGLDPTNDMEVTDQHIRIGVGRDAHDCLINRGILHGISPQTQTVKVTVKEIGE